MVGRAGRGKCGCTEKPELRNLIDDSEEVGASGIRARTESPRDVSSFLEECASEPIEDSDRRLRNFTATATYRLNTLYTIPLFYNAILYDKHRRTFI